MGTDSAVDGWSDGTDGTDPAGSCRYDAPCRVAV